ncbi:LamG-like jellyroll fold domain-containing protein [Haloferula chungangensis]|uniref:LamG-like jellyroll fold domain-containing protein n=1 Tax=Haloferula chungangensis TaxID=1048331 RepID=A0ABW2L459_9BACT
MERTHLIAAILSLVLGLINASAYEVWMGTHLMTHTDANDLSTWSTVAPKVEGLNINRAPHDTDPATNNDWRQIFAQFTGSRNAIHGFARSEATKDPSKTDELAFPAIAQRLEELFGFESTYGYDLTDVMFYDERGTYQGTEYLYVWTDIEIQYMRDWLDTNGHSDVKLKWNVRNNSQRNREVAAKPLVDSVEIEASTTALLNNTNNQITFFEWFWDNPATANKPIVLQIPRTLDSLNQFKGTRRVAQMIGGIIGYGEDGMRSDRLIFLPVTYNDKYPYTPEFIDGGTSYTNTLTSIALSLIEQRELFEGRLPQLPTVADADDLTRTVPPTVSPMIDRVVNKNASTPAIPFTVGDTDTSVGSLTVSATSSNTLVVPTSGIVFGGSGANRTVTITPAAGQSGVSEITIMVSDGKWSDSSTFTLTVGGVLVSQAADAAIRDTAGPSEQSASTTVLGSGGSSPFVDRNTVYVFQLPDLGLVSDPFTNASFAFNYISKDGTVPNVDLYGLGRRDDATVLASDYYGQTSTADPSDATRLQTSILTNATPLGAVSTSASGNTALLNYLNAQYASGAGIGEFVFLRLSSTVPKNSINRATVTMSEGGVSNLTTDTRPRIAYTSASDPGIGGLAATSMRQDTSTVIPFTINNMSATSLVVTATSSNTTLLSNNGIVIGGSGLNRTLTITPAAGQSGQTDITVTANNGTQSANATFKLTVLRTLLATNGDAEVQPTLGTPTYEVINASADTLLVGTAGGNTGKDRCVVFPFQLPDLGAVANPFNAAFFTVNHASNQSTPLGNVSLYGLGSRASETVMPGDYWSATPDIDSTDATLLQEVLVQAGSASFGLKTTDAANSGNLVAYLNAQYAGGAGIGNYVFLRLSADAAQTGGANRYVFTGANGANSNTTIHPQINFLTNDQVQTPVVTLVALGSPVDQTAGSSWSDGLAPHANARYIIPATGNLRGPSGTSTFPGFSLTVEMGGRYQIRALDGSGQVATVGQLLLEGGSSFASGEFAELAAGTGTNATNVIDGIITNSGHSRFLTFGTVGGNLTARNLRFLSLVFGSGHIQALEGSALRQSSVIVENAGNSFYGTWEVAEGSSLVFENAGAVGTADIEVMDGGVLEIKGNWNTGAMLAVSSGPGTDIKLGTYGWKVSALIVGGSFVADGVYTAAELNALAGTSVFSGNGTITVGAGLPGGPIAHWKLDEASGTTAIDSSGGGKAGSLLHGATWDSDGTRGSFVSFDGSDDRISTPFRYALSSSDDFTWSWWAKSNLATANTSIMVGNRYGGSGSESLEFIKFMPQKATFVNGGLDDREDYDYTDITNDGWHHYAMVKSGTEYQWYVDGVAQGAPVTILYTESDLIQVSIGGDDDDATPGGREGEHFQGGIDDVALYDRPLTQAEVQGVRDGNYGFLPPNTAQEDWRDLYFGTTENSGTAADDYDANFDGEDNLLEFATGQDPFANTFADISLSLEAGSIEFRYVRSSSAIGDGIQFIVEWSDTLAPESWSNAGVTDIVDPFDPGSGDLQNRIATIPEGNTGRRFVRLAIVSP